MRTTLISAAAAMALALPGAALADTPADADILYSPVGGVENNHWIDYQTDLLEAESELRSDLARATDEDDVFDARAEYRAELADAMHDYQKEMIEDGYPIGRVIVGD